MINTISTGARAAKHLVSSADDQIRRYSDKFRELRSALQQTAAVHTEIVVLRVMSAVQDIGLWRFWP